MILHFSLQLFYFKQEPSDGLLLQIITDLDAGLDGKI